MKGTGALVALALFAPGCAWADATVTNVTGSASVRESANAAPRPLKAGDVVKAGSWVATGEASRASLRHEDGTVTRIGPNSSLQLRDPEAKRPPIRPRPLPR